MDFQLISNLFNKHIRDKTDLSSGAQELDQFLKENLHVSFLDKIDLNRLDNEFKQRVKTILSTKRISDKIQSLYFGLVTLAGHDSNPETSIYLTGSKTSPEDDPDWAGDVDYQGGEYIYPTDFAIIDPSLSDDMDVKGLVEVIIFNGLLILLIINSLDLIKELTFHKTGLFSKSRKSLWLGSGFDSGDCYLIGSLNK